ncbi:MAG: hypothetical protein IGS39_19825 [Calothrix sp. C42_A2020_038]|nr:hypothetical protein [Calothrix sp. C42_A2020_038]
MPLNESLRNPIRDVNTTYLDKTEDINTTLDATLYTQGDLNQKEFKPSTFGDSVTLLIPILFILTTIGVVLYKLKQVKPISYPCKTCKYYNSNNYIRCAVNPTEVMTEKANDCRDYSCEDKKMSWFSWKGFKKWDRD